MGHARDPSTQEAEAGQALCLRPAWSEGQPGLHRRILTQNQQHQQYKSSMSAVSGAVCGAPCSVNLLCFKPILFPLWIPGRVCLFKTVYSVTVNENLSFQPTLVVTSHSHGRAAVPGLVAAQILARCDAPSVCVFWKQPVTASTASATVCHCASSQIARWR